MQDGSEISKSNEEDNKKVLNSPTCILMNYADFSPSAFFPLHTLSKLFQVNAVY